MKKNIDAFSLIEISVVLAVISAMLFIIHFSAKLRYSGKLANAVNMTANANFIENDSLVLWLETSILSKNKNEDKKISTWRDNSKNSLIFTNNTNPPLFKKSKTFPGIKSIYFNGSNHLESEIPLNLSQYTAFIVIKPDTLSSSTLFDSGFNAKINNLFDNKIIILKNDGSSKYIKRNARKNFEKISNSDNLDNIPSKFYIGSDGNGANGYKGEIFELIIFDKVLNNKDISNIESYLNNKYMR